MAEPRLTHIITSEIPAAVIGEASEAILRHTVALLAVHDSSAGGSIELWGTGSLVRINGVPCFLTAAHVWQKLKLADAIGIGLIEERHRALVDPRKVAVVAEIGPGRRDWLGPDLAVLYIAEAIGSVEAYGKAFLDVSKRREAMLTGALGFDVGVWAIAGAPRAASETDGQIAKLYMGPYFSGVDRIKTRNGFDYFDVGANYKSNPDAPTSFRGVSGGGLWRVLLVPGTGAGVVDWDGKPRLEGVAFYQTARLGDRRFIRCHGTRSIYDQLLGAIGGFRVAPGTPG